MKLEKISKLIFKNSFKIIVYMLIMTSIYIVATKGFEFGEKLFAPKNISIQDGTEIVVSIPENATNSEVAEILYKKKLIDDKLIYRIQSIIYEAKYHQGNFTLNTAHNAEDIIDILKNVDNKVEEETKEAKDDEVTQETKEIKED